MVSRRKSSSKKATNKPSFATCFIQCCKDFCLATSLDGYQYMVKSKTKFERNLWKLIQLAIAALLIYLTVHAWEKFMRTPVITSLESTEYLTTEVNFPGVSICNINKIDRKRAEALANRLGDPSLTESLRLLGIFYDYSAAKEKEALLAKLETTLDKYLSDNETTGFDPYKLLKELTTPCSEMLSDCFWAGDEYPCMDLFVMETSMEGFCCLFNYVPARKAALSKIVKDNGENVLKSKGSDLDMGLEVRVATDEDTYMYPLISSIGTNVHIFEPSDFPDTSSGNLYERVVPVNVEAFIHLHSSTVHTMPEARKYSPDKRNCIFEDEASTIFGDYSFSDCMMTCRMDSIWALCHCVPFIFYQAFSGKKERPQCTLSDLVCLEKYQDKWYTLRPRDYEDDELRKEMEYSLDCRNCMPACSDTLYYVDVGYGHIANPKNFSVIHIYFQEPTGDLLKQDVLYYWFDIISLFGGTFSVVVGISFISVMEIVYFFTYRLYQVRQVKRR